MLKIVVSGVNMVEGGILSILEDLLLALSHLQVTHELSVIVLVHDLRAAEPYKDLFKVLTFPEIKRSWIKRLRFEYVDSKKLSQVHKPDLWISLHDMTPNVACAVRVVYCHNPSPFYKLPLKYFFYDTTFSLFTVFYKYLYAINIKKNDFVIVQQSWIRKSFKKMFGVATIVAYPHLSSPQRHGEVDLPLSLGITFDRPVFFYPSFPRVFKNMECVCRAAEILSSTFPEFHLLITMSGSENRYAAKIYNDHKHVSQIKFIGLQSRSVIESLYGKVNCLVFPSKLETWGLPISEFMPYNKPILVADLPYAHETVGDFKLAKYFKADNPEQLAIQMKAVIKGAFIPDVNVAQIPAEPFFDNWDDLLTFLIKYVATRDHSRIGENDG